MTRPPGSDAPLRILADDLSGALDAAGPFAVHAGPVVVAWDLARAGGPTRLALDLATRERDAHATVARTRAAAHALWAGEADALAVLKVDSVWRGHPAAAVAAAAAEGGFDRVVVAPAFPQQGRVTREGSQWTAEARGWREVAPDIPAELRRHGLDAIRETQAPSGAKAVVCDAIVPEDLDAIVARHARPGTRTLWCGTSGLARALAARTASPAGAPGPVAALPQRVPVLVVVGTDHPVATAQATMLARDPAGACRIVDAVARVTSHGGASASQASTVLLHFRTGGTAGREQVREAIAAALRHEVAALPVPGLVVATGGETLRALSEALGAAHLEVAGEFEPGIPIARWSDGRWAGTPVVSKSGGFGTPDLFVRVVSAVAPPPRS